ncbi:hypothetical protein WMY93_006169 [Mugilogobius chulae]|uniref:Alkylated DNA repair protein AlkB homologue 8 N-terminal domain-containing protein n=1 Tax=Mugilogobius chulae TaxID=88201 RepID=A0AAW0PM90_9GOBI
MYFLRQLKKAKLPVQMMVQFYTAIIESILTSSITVWYAGATVRDRHRLQRIVRSAEKGRMTTKRRLITDSYRVVKRERRGGKREKSPTPPPTPEQIANAARLEDLEKLKQFDLDWRFGPCTGISRLQRWERAQVHGLNPPEEIKELLLQSEHDPELRDSLWREYPF